MGLRIHLGVIESFEQASDKRNLESTPTIGARRLKTASLSFRIALNTAVFSKYLPLQLLTLQSPLIRAKADESESEHLVYSPYVSDVSLIKI